MVILTYIIKIVNIPIDLIPEAATSTPYFPCNILEILVVWENKNEFYSDILIVNKIYGVIIV
jgi:hypothetical protein